MRHALGLFTALPYADVSVTRVAELCEMSPGLLYHYFPSKRALYLAVLEAVANDFAAEASFPTGAPTGWSTEVAAAYARFAAKRPDALRFLLTSGLDGDPEVTGLLADAHQTLIAPLGSQAHELAARGWLGFIEAVYLRTLGDDVASPETTLAAAAEALAPLLGATAP